ncbi:hypothetical protein M5D96_010457 [Drosophila gunungcola]|uniref:Uncharacterized protein n=2 Tax=Drosophila gunungcola TaxID=103775 RepID=A0A9P9YGQ0_9MUSC|nr:hypothetical protein M5D96_010457 [Drosophila gunungcola]
MSKATIIFAIVCLCVAVQAQSTVRPRDPEICQTENAKCLRNERRLGRESDISNIFNNHCRGADRSWRNISRCELSMATCRLTLENCSLINCHNVKRTLGGGGVTGRPPTPSSRTTTRRTPTPRTPSPATRTSFSSYYYHSNHILALTLVAGQERDCRELERSCERCVERLHNPNDRELPFFNRECREKTRRTWIWRNVGRCELSRINCIGWDRRMNCGEIAEVAGMRRRTD